MHELDSGGHLDVILVFVAAQLGGGQRQHWAQALAAGIDQVVGEFRDRINV